MAEMELRIVSNECFTPRHHQDTKKAKGFDVSGDNATYYDKNKVIQSKNRLGTIRYIQAHQSIVAKT